jgi:penicillin-binding protein 1A
MVAKAKKRKKKKKSRFSKKKVFLYLFLLFLLGIVLAALFVLSIYLGAFGKLPDATEITGIKQDNATLVYASDGSLMGKYYEINRQSINNEDISPYVRQALIATEDNRFFEHHGVDMISLGRVIFKSIIMGDGNQGGGSTISQQLAKNLFTRKDYGILSLPVNKIREMFIAPRLEEVYSKEEILTLYLNTVAFGENVYGIEAAARRFYNKPSSSLSISESATLIGMLAANTAYNPRINPENAKARRNVVLSRMFTQGFITQEQLNKTKDEAIKIDYRLMDINRGVAPYFREFIRIQAENILAGSHDIETEGLRIYTTINSSIQSFAEDAVARHMKKLQAEFNQHWKGREPLEKHPSTFDQALKRTDAYKKYQGGGMSHEEIMKALSVPHKRNILTGDGEKVLEISSIDSLKHYIQLLNTGFLAIDTKTGAILAWVGGINHQYLPYDHVLSKRQAGSTFKPFVYAAALQSGMSPCRFISNEKRVYEDYQDWSPGNSGGEYGGYYSMKGGLMKSVNTITAEVMIETGPSTVVDLAEDMGIRSPLPEVPSLALGTADVSLYEMLRAYSAFANNGIPVEPFGIIRIEDKQGNVIYENKEVVELRRAFDEDLGMLMTSMLEAVVDSGTARSLRSVYGLRSDLAGKTGTTQNNADGWFIGYSPNIVAGAWVGAELPSVHFRTTALGSGSHMALPIFGMTFRKIEANNKLSAQYLPPFAPLPLELLIELDCPAYTLEIPDEYLTRKERREFRKEERAFRKEDNKEEQVVEEESENAEEKPGFFKRVGNFFRKKDKKKK